MGSAKRPIRAYRKVAARLVYVAEIIMYKTPAFCENDVPTQKPLSTVPDTEKSSTMTTKNVCYGKNKNQALARSGQLTELQAFTLTVVEHVLGSALFFVGNNSPNFNETLLKAVKESGFIFTDQLFLKFIEDSVVRTTAVYSIDALHDAMDNAKMHVDSEWRVPEHNA